MWRKHGDSAVAACGRVSLTRRFRDAEHVDVDLAQLCQRAVDVVALLLKQFDLLAAFLAGDRRRPTTPRLRASSISRISASVKPSRFPRKINSTLFLSSWLKSAACPSRRGSNPLL